MNIEKIKILWNSVDSMSVGVGLLSIVFMSLIMASSLFCLGLCINNWLFLISCICSIGFVRIYCKKNNYEVFPNVLIFVLLVAFSLLIATFTFDYSWDGCSYHQDIILQLRKGWNPYYIHHAPNFNSELALWGNHYAKGMETISAVIYAFTGRIESGKAVSLLLVISSFCFVKNALNGILKSSYKVLFYSLAFSFSPVIFQQAFTFYIDWSLYSLMLILVSMLLSIKKDLNVLQVCCIAICIIMSIAIKYNIAFWIGFTIFLYWIYLLFQKRYQIAISLILIGVISLIIGILFTGFNPYITNYLDHSNPFYPLLGEYAVDIMTDQMPVNMRNNSDFVNVFISLFSHGTTTGDSARFMFPFLFNIEDLKVIANPDPRTCGFGVFFSGLMLLSIVLYAFAKMEKHYRNISLVICTLLFFSLFVLPSGSWSRYTPFFYTFPLILLLFTEFGQLTHKLLHFRRILYTVILFNILSIFIIVSILNIYCYLQTQKAINIVRVSNNPNINFGVNVAFKIKLDERNIRYVEQKNKIGLNTLLHIAPEVCIDSDLK